MNKHRLSKLYPSFTPHERFRLVVEAGARQDYQEVERLAVTCPHETYYMNEAAYQDRVQTGSSIATMAWILFAPPLAKLEMIKAFRVVQPYAQTRWAIKTVGAYLDGHEAGSRHAWRCAGMKGDPPGWEAGEREEHDEEPLDANGAADLQSISAYLGEDDAFVPKLLEELERGLVKEVLTVWEAFAGFCEEELDLEPEKLLKANLGPTLPQIEQLKDIANGSNAHETDLEEVTIYRETFSRAWNNSVGGA